MSNETPTTAQDAARAEIPSPPDFPIKWETEEDRGLLWQWSDVHCPLPASPMSHSLSEASSGAGMKRVARDLGQDSSGRRSLVVNGYSYYAVGSKAKANDDEGEDAGKRIVEESIATIRGRWDSEMLPSLKQDLKYMAGVDLSSLSDGGLIETLDEFLELANEHWYTHFLVVYPVHAAADRLVAAYREVMGKVPEEEPMRLLQGLDNMSMVVDRALRELAETARASAPVAGAFEAGTSGGGILDRLEALPAAGPFLDALRAFLSEHGYRPASFDSIYPSWIEDPSFVLLNVKSYLTAPPRDLASEREQLAGEAAACLGSALEAIGGDEEKKEAFLRKLEQAKELWPLKEDHSYYIDQGSVACVRLVIAEIGRRLSRRGDLDDAEDVHYMTLEEARRALASAAQPDLRGVVAPRKQERERYLRVLPPQYIGSIPPEGMPDEATADSTSEEGGGLRGSPASRGSYTGPARIVRGPEQFHRVRPGDVLVCTSTSPTWTPLFGTVGALVSEAGGALSHTAIVAREYSLPAAVGVSRATARIADGQLVTVDGESGAVLLH